MLWCRRKRWVQIQSQLLHASVSIARWSSSDAILHSIPMTKDQNWPAAEGKLLRSSGSVSSLSKLWRLSFCLDPEVQTFSSFPNLPPTQRSICNNRAFPRLFPRVGVLLQHHPGGWNLSYWLIIYVDAISLPAWLLSITCLICSVMVDIHVLGPSEILCCSSCDSFKRYVNCQLHILLRLSFLLYITADPYYSLWSGRKSK